MKTRVITTVLVLLVVFAACGDDESADTTSSPAADTTMAEDMDMTDETMAEDMDMDEDMDMGDEDHMEEFAFGDSMEAATATRVIEITANDDFTFDPPSVTVTAGETVTFRVTNAGVIPHDFTLGNAEMQDEHEAEMAEMGAGMAHDEANVFALEPGETKEMTWHLTEAGEILFGCHQLGHFAAGMKGTITIES